MIESTFTLLRGIGEQTERRWWHSGILDWTDFHAQAKVPGLSSARKGWYDEDLMRAREALMARNPQYFASCLRPRDHWRLLPLFSQEAVYLDIETTGEDPGPDSVTVVGLAQGGRLFQLVAGEQLTERALNEVLGGAPLLVTFFGSGFDVPFLKRAFPGLIIPPLHLDLCFAARRIGLRGGLKAVEHEIGLARSQDLEGLGGWDAVTLWHEYVRGHTQSLDRLLRYNQADVEHLIPLAQHIYEAHAQRCEAYRATPASSGYVAP